MSFATPVAVPAEKTVAPPDDVVVAAWIAARLAARVEVPVSMHVRMQERG